MQVKFNFFLSLSLVLLLGVGAKVSHAADINVTTTAIAGDCFNPGGDPCTNFNGNDCTLQDALDVAECNGELDSISLAPGDYDASTDGTYTYSMATNETFPLTLNGNFARIICSQNDTRGMFLETDQATDDFNGGISMFSLIFQDCTALGGNGGGLLVETNEANVSINLGIFLGNTADVHGGGLAIETSSGPVQLQRTFFNDNHSISDGNGGGLYVQTFDSSVRLENGIFAENSAVFQGGGAYFESGTGSYQIINNTFFNNTAEDGADGFGGGISAVVDDSSSVIDIYNNIVWGNTAGTDGDDIFTCEQGGTVNLFNNDFSEFISGGVAATGFCGSNPTINQDATNINQDPLFVDSSPAVGDFHLTANSPVIDKGTLTPPGGLPSQDADGIGRPQGPLPDMGALEFGILPIPTPTPIPIPTPTPLPGNPLLEGSGLLSCSFHQGLAMIASQGWTGFLSIGAWLGFLMVLRRKAR